MFFESWDDILRVMSVGVLAYAGLVIMLRISSNSTLSKMNAFDLVVTVALGSTLSTILVSKDLSLATGLAALALLVVLQLLITWCSVRSSLVSRVVKTAPTVLLLDGALRRDAMRSVRITGEEVMAAVRQQGQGSLADIDAVILESDGSLSVITAKQAGDRSAYAGLVGASSDAIVD